jgi:hypothetical protein
MRGLLLLTVVTLASARPEAGYSYNAPNRGGHSGGHGGGHGGHVSHSSGFGSAAGSGQFIGSLGGGNSFNGASSGSFGGASSFGGGSFGGSQSFGGGHAGAVSGGQTVVQKHIYVHVPPEEDEAVHHQQQFPVAPPQKHYKIIFIKAPSAPSVSQQLIQAQAQNQEKTLIYVLVKKPEDISFNAPDLPKPLAPSKPEVYFIKYKTQKEAGGAGHGGLAVGGSSGGSFGTSGAGTTGFSSGGSLSSVGSAVSSGSASGISAPNPATAYGAPGGGYHK